MQKIKDKPLKIMLQLGKKNCVERIKQENIV